MKRNHVSRPLLAIGFAALSSACQLVGGGTMEPADALPSTDAGLDAAFALDALVTADGAPDDAAEAAADALPPSDAASGDVDASPQALDARADAMNEAPDALVPSDAAAGEPDASEDGSSPSPGDCRGQPVCNVACGVAGLTDCTRECREAERCDISCAGSVRCDLTCRDVDECYPVCVTASSCQVHCRDTEHCRARCATGSSCAIDCEGSDCTEVDCAVGAACLIRCINNANCGFRTCAGGERGCSNNVRVCGMNCPEEG